MSVLWSFVLGTSCDFWASPVAQPVKNLPAMRRPGFDPWIGKIPYRRERLPTPIFWPRQFLGLYSPWCSKELDTPERLSLHFTGLIFHQLFVMNL